MADAVDRVLDQVLDRDQVAVVLVGVLVRDRVVAEGIARAGKEGHHVVIGIS